MANSKISLQKDEKILAELKPNNKAFKKSNLLGWMTYVFLGIIVIGILTSVIFTIVESVFFDYHTGAPEWIGFAVFGILLISSMLLIRKLNKNSYENAEYTITNKRVSISYGVWGKNNVILNYDKIANIEILKGPFDKKFNTGSIVIYTNIYSAVMSKAGPSMSNVRYLMANLDNPQDTVELINKQLSSKQ